MVFKRFGLPLLMVGAVAATPAIAVPAAEGQVQPGRRLVGYFTQWSAGERDFLAKDLITNGSAARLTNLNYAFGDIDESGKCVSSDAEADYRRSYGAVESVSGRADRPNQQLRGNLNQLKQLKAKYPKLRVSISLGGWTRSKYFSNAALTPESRAAHVKSCLDLWLKGNLPGLRDGAGAGVFDGIDLDWEWPATAGNTGTVFRPEDKQNFTALVREYRSELDKLSRATYRKYDLTAFLPASPYTIDNGIEVAKVIKDFTFVTTQGYDYHGAWDKVTNQQSAIDRPEGDPAVREASSQVVIDAYLQRGVPLDKLVMGVPFYGRGWKGVGPTNNGLFQPAAGPADGISEAGYEDYRRLKAQVGKFTVHRDEKAGFAWLYDGNTFWTWDDATEMRRKASYINERQLSGAMIWSLDGDTRDGELIKALHSTLRR